MGSEMCIRDSLGRASQLSNFTHAVCCRRPESRKRGKQKETRNSGFRASARSASPRFSVSAIWHLRRSEPLAAPELPGVLVPPREPPLVYLSPEASGAREQADSLAVRPRRVAERETPALAPADLRATRNPLLLFVLFGLLLLR